MTNLEWVKNNDDKLLMNVLIFNLAVCKNTGKAARCGNISCNDCLFIESTSCIDSREEWLKQEHQPLYKKGDIVIDGEGKIYLVISESCDILIVTDNFNDFISNRLLRISYIDVTEVKGRIGNYLYYDNDQKKKGGINYESL